MHVFRQTSTLLMRVRVGRLNFLQKSKTPSQQKIGFPGYNSKLHMKVTITIGYISVQEKEMMPSLVKNKL